jgi:uncharacterized protein (UPF0332 family)
VTEVPLLPVEIELGKARRLLEAAEHLARGGFHEDAVSRAYYAVFHAGCALLASIGRTVRTHDGLRMTIGEHFVRTGKLDPRFARVLARSAADRNDADYNSTATFLAEDAKDAIQGAREFVAEVEGLVTAGG